VSLLEVRELSIYFGPRKVVDRASFTLDAGEKLALVGESASGKTVTALSTLRLIEDARLTGEIIFNGKNVPQMPPAELHQMRGRDIAVIFQEPMTALNPLYTVGQQIVESLELHTELRGAASWTAAVEAMRRVGIDEPERRAHSYPHQLSGGQRQRAMIAMALACNPKLLIADEPTTALDVTVQAQILELMKDLRERLGMAILLITHDLGVVAEMVDEVAVMYAGRIVERGPVAEVFAEPQHPYTEALLRSIPRVGMRYTQPLKAIRGMVPSPLEWQAGCRFAPRCDYAFDRCLTDDPWLLPVPPQESACWLCKDGRRVTGYSEVAR
jgi:oligopeptide/dipeptide ABC transporter ATP-binding protein